MLEVPGFLSCSPDLNPIEGVWAPLKKRINGRSPRPTLKEALSLTQKPTIVVVPGSFTLPYLYSTFISQLTTHKHDVIVADLPSVGGKTATTITDDAQAIQAMTSNVADEGKDIILIMHSYDGVPRAESAHGVTKKERARRARKEVWSRCYKSLRSWSVLESHWGRRWEKVLEFRIVSKSRYAVHLLPFST